MIKWIDVNKELPVLFEKVLVITGKPYQIKFAHLVINGEDVKGKYSVLWNERDVKYWLPLPKLPEDK